MDAAIAAAAATQDVATKQAAYATIQDQIATRPALHPGRAQRVAGLLQREEVLGLADRESDLYANPLPYLSVASAVVLTHLEPAK